MPRRLRPRVIRPNGVAVVERMMDDTNKDGYLVLLRWLMHFAISHRRHRHVANEISSVIVLHDMLR